MNETHATTRLSHTHECRQALNALKHATTQAIQILARGSAYEQGLTGGDRRMTEALKLLRTAQYFVLSASLISISEVVWTAEEFETLLQNLRNGKRAIPIEFIASEHEKLLAEANRWLSEPPCSNPTNSKKTRMPAIRTRPDSSVITERRAKVLDHLRNVGKAHICEIAKATGLNYPTVSNDLHYMLYDRDKGRSPKRVCALGEGIYEAIQETTL